MGLLYNESAAGARCEHSELQMAMVSQ